MDEEKSFALEILKDMKEDRKEQNEACEKKCKRDFAIIVILIIALFSSNMAWIYTWQSYDYETTETITTVETTDGGNAYYTESGDILNGEDQKDNNDNKKK